MHCIETKVIYDAAKADPSQAFAGTPSLTTLSDGTLLCAFKTGSAKISASDNIRILKSNDQGSSWSALINGFDTSLNGISGSIHSCYISEMADNNLFAACCWVDRSDPVAPYANPVTGGLRPIKCLLSRSSDSGQTWSSFDQISFRYHKAAAATGKILKLSNGSLLLTYESYKEWNEVEGNYSAACLLSNDNGSSWSWPVTFARDPFAKKFYWDNKICIIPGSGELVAALWTVTNDYENISIHLVRGTPAGLNWGAPEPVGFTGKSAAPLFVDNRTLLLLYVDPAANAIKAAISDDAGHTWHNNHLVIYKADVSLSKQKDFYSATFGGPEVILCGNDVIAVYYAGNENCLSIYSARIKI